jgi:hypothetical protein
MKRSDGLTGTAGRVGWLAKLLLIVASLAFATLLSEAGLRLSGRYRPNAYPPQCLRPGLYEAYEPYGYRLIPSRRATYLYPLKNPRKLSLVSNRDGFRAGRELEEPDPRPRILFLGDSFVFGDGVEESERFTNVLEASKSCWRIDNLGMVGYGPDLMLRALEVVGLKLKPTLVVFCMYTDDFRRVRPDYAGTGFLIPRYKLESRHLVSVPYPQPSLWDRLSISVAVSKILWNYTNWQWDLNQAILDRFEELADKEPFQKAIIFLPGRDDTKTDRERRAWLAQYASRHATPFLDLSGVIQTAGDRVFIKDNPHLNPMGHQVVARELDRFLSEQPLPSH